MTSAEGPFVLPPERRTFCNSTLNPRSIQALGLDLDNTLVNGVSDSASSE